MISQTTARNETISTRNPVASVASRVADVAGDFVELVELQATLTKNNVQQLVVDSKPALLGVSVGAILSLSAFMLILLAAANGLTELYSFRPWLSQLIVAVASLATASVIVIVSLRKLKGSLSNLDSSTGQLAQNIAWLKGVIRGN
ncbi:MAG: phage holin family protein [Pirellulales bacterium]